MTNGPDDPQPGQQPPPPPPPPPSGGGRGLFARNDPDQPGPPPPPQRVERTPPPPREDPRTRQRPEAVPPQGSDDNPFLLPNERDRMPVYGGPPLPVVPLGLMVAAIVIGAVLFFMSQENTESGGITPQQASSNVVLHMDGLDITETTFRQQTAQGIKKGNIACERLAGQPPENIAAGLRLGVLKMTVPTQSGVAPKKDQKADDASLLLAARIVLDSCPKGAAPAPAQPVNPPPGGNQPPPAGTPAPAPPPGGNQPAPGGQPPPAGTQAPPPAGTPRPNTPAPPAATPRP